MEINYKQTEFFGCGLFSVANTLLLNDDFVTEDRIEESKKGNSLTQLNRWLVDSEIKASIEPWFYNHNEDALPESFFEYRPVDENIFLPVLFDVRITETTKRTHFVGGWIDSNSVLYLIDSLKNSVVQTSIKDLSSIYYNVFGFYSFLGDDGNYINILKQNKED